MGDGEEGIAYSGANFVLFVPFVAIFLSVTIPCALSPIEMLATKRHKKHKVIITGPEECGERLAAWLCSRGPKAAAHAGYRGDPLLSWEQ
jgi:hypothetical protein